LLQTKQQIRQARTPFVTGRSGMNKINTSSRRRTA
jgi:hypothetical protein